MTELDYTILDPGIRGAVQYLRERGFDTTDSGDGTSKPEGEGEGDIAHVAIITTDGALVEECKRLVRVLDELHIKTLPMSDEGTHTDSDEVVIQGTYDPAAAENKRGIIVVMGSGLLNIVPPPYEERHFFSVSMDDEPMFISATNEEEAKRIFVQDDGTPYEWALEHHPEWAERIEVRQFPDDEEIAFSNDDKRPAGKWARIAKGVFEP